MEKVKDNAGTLEVRVLCARDLKSVEMFGRQDPFFKVIVGTNAPWISRTCTDAGTKPVWNEVNKFPINGKEGNLRVEVWDHNAVSSDSLIGGAIVPLQNVLTNGSDSSRVIICDQRGKTAGEVEMVLVFQKDAKKDKLNMMPGYGQAGQPGYGQPSPAGYPGQQAAPSGYPTQPGAPAGYPSQQPAHGQPGYGSQPAPHQPTPITVNIVNPSQPAGSGYPQSSAPQGYPQTSAPQGYPAQNPSPYGAAPQAYSPAQSANPYGTASNPYGAPPAQNPYGAPPASNPYGAPASYGGASNPYGAAPSYGAQSGYPPAANVFGAPPPNAYGAPPNPYSQGPSI